jgi:hypothetical protein
MTSIDDPSLSHPPSAGKEEEEDGMETSSSSATEARGSLPDEKDARDHLTPTALVHTGVRNATDLEKGDAAADVIEQLDKALASVPPTLARQTALPSQPGAFRAGGARNGTEDVANVGGESRIAGLPTGLIEATLVEEEEGAPVQAPIYKGQIVLEEDGDSAPDKANVVTLSKKQVRCFLLAFGFLCCMAIVLSIVLTLVESTGDVDVDPDRTENARPEDKESSDVPEGYWYEDAPEELWEMLQDRSYITHHMALVSIVNPHLTMMSAGDDGASLQCSPLKDTHLDWDDNRRSLRRDDANLVVVSFTCGTEQSVPPSVVNGDPLPDAVILMHDGATEALHEEGNRTIACRDAKHFSNGTLKYNQVFCAIPNDDRMDGRVLSFFFSCFSRAPLEPVAAVQTHDLSAKCRVVNDPSSSFRMSEGDVDVPQVLVTAPAAVLLSTQRLCRVSENIVLQSSIVAEDWRNHSQNCSQGWRGNDDSELLVCLSQTLPVNHTVPLTALSVCSSNNWTQPCLEVRLANVTIYDQLRDDLHECAPASLNESLIVPGGQNDLPVLQPWNNATWEEVRTAIRAQEFWVERWLLPAS